MGNKHYNFIMAISLTSAILIFSLGFLTWHFISTIQENNPSMSQNKNFSSSTILMPTKENKINKSEEKFPAGAPNVSENNNEIIMEKTISLTVEESTTRQTTNDINTTLTLTNGQINMKGAITRPIFHTQSITTKPVSPGTSNVTLLKEPKINSQSCLKYLPNHFKEMPGETDRCVNRPAGNKSAVSIQAILEEPFTKCLNSKEEACDQFYHEAKEKNMGFGFPHIDYHFIMGDHGNLFEGRPLSCYWYETDIPEWRPADPNIIVGIPFCPRLDSGRIQEKNQFNLTLKKLLDCLKNEGVLTDDYSIIIYRDCEDYLNEVFLETYEKRISFYSIFD